MIVHGSSVTTRFRSVICPGACCATPSSRDLSVASVTRTSAARASRVGSVAVIGVLGVQVEISGLQLLGVDERRQHLDRHVVEVALQAGRAAGRPAADVQEA